MANNKDFIVKNAVEVGGPTKVTVGDAATGGSYVNAYDVANASYDSVSFSVSSQESGVTALSFKPDGTVVYVVGTTNDTVYQYSLSTAWDLSSASYGSVNFYVAGQEASPTGLMFKPDGTKMYIVGISSDTIYQYSLSTAWNVSTASYDSVSFSVAGQDTSPRNIQFKSDGTKLYVTGYTNDTIYQYSLSTAYDLSTASYDSVSLSVTSQDTAPTGIFFKSDGTKMYMVGQTNRNIFQYTLSTAWDLSTASYDSVSFSFATQDDAPCSIAFGDSGTKMYMLGQVSPAIYQYSTGSTVTTGSFDLSTGNYFTDTPSADVEYTFSNAGDVQSFQLEVTGDVKPYDLSGAAYDSKSFSVASQEATPRDVAFKSDGTKMYVIGSTGDDVNEYSLSTAWDVSTASYTTVFSVSSQDATPTSIHFKPDGTSFYITGSSSDYAYQYTMSTAWDISTASYAVDSLYLSATSPTAMSIYIKPDGTKVYTLSDGNDAVYQWTLSTAWDLSTGTYDSVSFSVASQAPNPWGMTFNSDGTKLFVSDYGYREVYQYSLSTAWDLSAASYDNVSFSVAGEDLFPYGITFKPDGLKMYVAGNYTDTIYQYTSGSAITVTWDADIAWPSGTAPDSPAAGEKDIYTFTTDDGGTTYIGVQSGDAFS